MQKTFLPICGFLWYPQVSLRISKAVGATGGVSCDKIAHVMRSKFINRLINHQSRILVDKFANGFPTKTPNEWPTWGIKTVVCYNSGSSVLKLLELINISCATTAPYQAAVSKMGLHNTRVQWFQRSNWENILRMF